MSANGEVLASRYELGPIIGQGAMGIVYRAVDRATGQTVALKALRPEIVAANPMMLQRFEREGEALRVLNHPNIVKMLDAFESQGRHYLVMEYVEGGSLQEILSQTPQLPVDTALRISLDLADALTRAHRLNITHRDLKPANILLAIDGTPRLTDFGIAQIGTSSHITEAGSVIGTYAYLSPEACMGSVVDTRSDIWSFGVLLFEMVAGRRPFEGNSPAALITGILHTPIPDIAMLRPGVPEVLQDLLYRMLNRNPDARIPSVRLVGAELEALIKQIETPITIPTYKAAPAIDHHFYTPTPTTMARRYNWPAQITPFIGREASMSAIDDMIDDPNCRLITLLGPGGMGKTRLALETAARRLAVCSDNIAFVPLAPLTSADYIVPTIAAAMGISVDGSDPKQQLLTHLHSQNLILVLDNFEHVLDGASIVNDILSAAPAITVLATSRSRLNLQAECIYDVPGMETPGEKDLDKLEENESAKVFLTYAKRARPGYELDPKERPAVAQICRMLDGLPLGLELAAAWMRTLPPKEIAEELADDMDFLESALRDVPDRHRGMRAVFEYSWRLLTEEDQSVLKKLSVFRGGFTRDAAKQVAGARVQVIAKLVDQSLLHRDPEGRFWHHELLRQYEAEKLEENADEERETLAAHSRYYTAFLSEWRGSLSGEKQKEVLAAFDEEIDNLRTAWRYTVEHGTAEDLAHYVEDLPSFYEIRGRQRDAGELFGWALERLEANRAADIQAGGMLRLIYARLNRIVGQSAYRLDQTARAVSLVEKALEIYRSIGSSEADSIQVQAEMALCLNGLGNIVSVTKDYARAQALFAESLAIYRAQKNERGAATTLNNLATVLKEMGDYAAAIDAYSTSLEYFRETRNEFAVAVLLNNLGHVANAMNNSRQARDYFREALPKAWALNSHPLVLDVLSGIVKVEAETDAERAASWAALIATHPAAYQDTKQRAQALLDALVAQLPAEVFAKAKATGPEQPLSEIVTPLLNSVPTA